MKKHSSPQSGAKKKKEAMGAATVGMDLGDRTSHWCALDVGGQIIGEGAIATTPIGLKQRFEGIGRCRIAIEVGTHSPWVSRLLKGLGHEVIVANARQVKLISQSSRKDDRLDARTLGRLARMDPELLRPVAHRSEQAQLDLTEVRVRAALVELRTSAINAARGMAKAMGERLPDCDAKQMESARMEGLPAELRKPLAPLIEAAERLSEAIAKCDREIEEMARTKYPETARLRQVKGVGPVIALTYVLTLEDKTRFRKSRDAAAYVGLRPRRRQSGERDQQLGISKEGDRYLRKLLVQGAHIILGQRSPDTDLKRWGMKLAERGGGNQKKRAIVAVARKLAVLLHRLWVSGEEYEPLRNSRLREKLAPAA